MIYNGNVGATQCVAPTTKEPPMPHDQAYLEAEQKNLNHDWKDYRMTLIFRTKIIKAIHHGNQVNQENQG